MVQPGKFALHASIQHDVAWTAVVMSFHFAKAGRAHAAHIKFTEVSQDGLVFWSSVR